MSAVRNHSLLIGNLHPMLRRVLAKATSLGYTNLPSPQNIALLNTFAKGIHASIPGVGVLVNSFDWLYIHANNSADDNFGRINWINVNEVATGTPTFTSKKGWTGNANFGHSVNSGPGWAAGDASMFFYSTVGGAASAVESVMVQGGANGQFATIRHRTNPRLDFLMNATTASAQILDNNAAANNTYYSCDVSHTHGVTTTWKNNTNITNISSGTGIQPDTSSLSMSITSPRITGIVGGGRSLYKHNGTTSAHPALNVIIQKYMAAVQALP